MTDVAPLGLDGVIRRYDWGSRTSIQSLLGERQDGRPAAELWFGAHPGDPSRSALGPLDQVIAADPVGWLGPQVADRFEQTLPYLLKVLAADTALSIQVHPTIAQARAGYDAERAAGLPLDAPDRNYSDRNHKPELLCALTRFEGVCGFRPVAETIAVLEGIGLPQLDFLLDALRGDEPLRTAFTAVLTHPQPAELATAVVRDADADGPLRAAVLAAEHFPGDVGVVLTLLLNHVVLEPGEAMFLGAGIVHAYLRGTGVEIMANSDNVLRCGLTAKHVDVPELLRIVDFVETADPRQPDDGGCFDVPVPDFRLCAVPPAGRNVQRIEPARTPRIALCVEGSVAVGDVMVGAGRAVFVPPGAGPIEVDGRVFVADVGRLD